MVKSTDSMVAPMAALALLVSMALCAGASTRTLKLNGSTTAQPFTLEQVGCTQKTLPPPPPLRVPPPPQPPGAAPTSRFELQPSLAMVAGVHLVHVPRTETYLLMERPIGSHPDGTSGCVMAGTYNAATGEWVPVWSDDTTFCSGHTITADGQVLVVGGHRAMLRFPAGIQSIRMFDVEGRRLVKLGNMRAARWYPTATLMPDGRIVIMGGTKVAANADAINPYYEVWDPAAPNTTVALPVKFTHLKNVQDHYYPFNYVLPTGDMFSFCARHGWIMEALSGRYIKEVPRRRGPFNSKYPFTATSVMLALRPETWDKEVEVMVFGGAAEQAVNNLTTWASKESQRIKVVLPQGPNGTYSFAGVTDETGWEVEQMGFPRVMGDATLLPNGHVLLLNGARQGVAGDTGPGGVNRANLPTFWAEIYNPYAAKGRRWSTLARSMIPRLYHSTAALTVEGTVLVSGCDKCRRGRIVVPGGLSWSPAPSGEVEYRVEVFYPPAWYANDRKPTIVDAPRTVKFRQRFKIRYGSAEGNPNQVVTGASLVAPSSTTHSFNSNQRVVMLELESVDRINRVALVKAPPNANIAQPQVYMLFLLNGDVYSRATWVKLEE